MATHVAYYEVQCKDAATCIETISRYLEEGWKLWELRGPRSGPFFVVFRKDDEP